MSNRPRKQRRGARVVVVSPAGVLLQRDSDPGVPGLSWWVTPGGGIDPGESERAAAARELAEETGLEAGVEELVGPVARRRVIHGYSDRILVQDEVFFRIEVPHFVPQPLALSPFEKQRQLTSAWFLPTELPAVIWPAELAQLISWQGSCLDLGETEESSVPVFPES